MYTWGYVKDAVLAKMDMTADEANANGLLNKIPYYANEAVVQIASGIKANRTTVEYKILDREWTLKLLARKYNMDVSYLVTHSIHPVNMIEDYKRCFDEYNSYMYAGVKYDMPKDFLQWTDDVVYKRDYSTGHAMLVHAIENEDYVYMGDHSIVFQSPGEYIVPYDGNYQQFTSTTDDDEILDMPSDIVNAIAVYVVSQLFKIDDEQKSSIYRNEYEIYLARINDNDYTTNRTFKTEGDW